MVVDPLFPVMDLVFLVMDPFLRVVDPFLRVVDPFLLVVDPFLRVVDPRLLVTDRPVAVKKILPPSVSLMRHGGAPLREEPVVKSPLVVPDTRPLVDFTLITQLGLKALSLALQHSALLDPRLPAGLTAGLGEDLEALGDAVPLAMQVRHEARSATVTQAARGREGHAFVRSVRAAARKARAPREVRAAYGVGQIVRPTVVNDVLAALQQILDRATAAPAEAATLGILAKDLAAMVAARDALVGADKVQEQKRASAPLSTKARNQTANRILHAVARISGAGMLEFAGEPELRASFEALKARRKSKKAEATPVVASPQAPSPPPGG